MTETKNAQKVGKTALAERVAPAVDIIQVRLIETHVKQNLIDQKYPPQVNLGRRSKTVRDVEQGRIVALASFVFDANDPENTAGSSVHMDATYELAYTVKKLDQFTDEEINAFGEVNGCYNAWPFWREYVYSTLARMGLSPLTLPVFRFDEDAADMKKESEAKKHE